jgi:ABC-2 type transport system permease protein
VFGKPETIMANQKFNVFDFLMPGQIAYMLLSSGLVSVSIALAQQRQSGTLRHLFSTPLSVGVWLSARVLANLMMAMIQVVVLYGVAVAVFKLTLPVNLFGTAVVLVISAMSTLGMGLVVGALSKSVDAAFPIAMILYMTLSFLGNAMMPLDQLSPMLQNLTKFVPSFYMAHSLKLVMMQGKGLGDAAFDLSILIGVAAVTMGLAMWQIRKQLIET